MRDRTVFAIGCFGKVDKEGVLGAISASQSTGGSEEAGVDCGFVGGWICGTKQFKTLCEKLPARAGTIKGWKTVDLDFGSGWARKMPLAHGWCRCR